MSYLIKKWYLPKEEDSPIADYTFQGTADWLDNLSKVNIFVGPNNSGKSRFMRHLASLDRRLFSPADFDLDNLIMEAERSRSEVRNIFKIPRIAEIMPGLFSGSIIPKDYIESDTQIQETFNDVVKLFTELANQTISIGGSHQEINSVRAKKAVNIDKLMEMRDQITNKVKSLRKSYNFKRIYIPTLRGLRPFEGLQDYYLQRTLKDYFDNKNRSNLLIFSGLELFGALRNHLLGDLSKRRLIADYEEFLGRTFFENKEITLIPREESGNDVVFVRIGEEKEFPIFGLGDGIQQLIIMTFPLFLESQGNILLFIEEPELYLHPGMQRILLEHLTGSSLKFENLQVFLTTHSNHFLDLSLDFDKVSIFKFNKELEASESEEKGAKFSILNTSNNDRNLLECLGVRNSSVLLTNCTIWVEGITDRLYIRRYLEVYMNQLHKEKGAIIFEEDKHYSFVEYSGNNITHWSFLENEENPINVESLCGTLFLIADRDNGMSKDSRHKKLTDILDKRYYRLKCREIENLLVKEVLLATIGDFKNAESKDEAKITYNDYKREPLGAFIDENILTKTSKKKFSADSGTLNCKVEFAKKAISHINSIEDMSKEAQELAGMLYEFISKHNQ